MHIGAARSVDGRSRRRRSHISLLAVQLLRIVDRGSDFPASRQPGHAQYGSHEDSQRYACRRAKSAWSRRETRRTGDVLWTWLGNTLVFPAIRKKMVGENLRALICGSAPLTPETQDYFYMLGITVLQVY